MTQFWKWTGISLLSVVVLAVPLAAFAEVVREGQWPEAEQEVTLSLEGVTRAEAVRLDIYDVAGQRVRRLIEGKLDGGYHEAVWDGRDASGFNAASGVYFVRLRAGQFQQTRPMALIR